MSNANKTSVQYKNRTSQTGVQAEAQACLILAGQWSSSYSSTSGILAWPKLPGFLTIAQRNHDVRWWTRKYVIAVAVTRTNSSCFQDPILSTLALEEASISVNRQDAPVGHKCARLIRSLGYRFRMYTKISGIDDKQPGQSLSWICDVRCMRRACERWVARAIFRSRGRFYLPRNDCHPRVRTRKPTQWQSRSYLLFSLFILYPWTKNCLLCRTVVLDGLDDVADSHGESIDVRI